jgi:hypothetical protein
MSQSAEVFQGLGVYPDLGLGASRHYWPAASVNFDCGKNKSLESMTTELGGGSILPALNKQNERVANALLNRSAN